MSIQDLRARRHRKTVRHLTKRTLLRLRDIANLIRHGPDAPRYAELIWVRPQDVQRVVFPRSRLIRMRCSGHVEDIRKSYRIRDLYGMPQYQSSVEHWVHGTPWEDTKDYREALESIRQGRFNVGCMNEQELSRRFLELDYLFDRVKQAGRLKTRQELDPGAFREEGGILVCLGRNAEPLLLEGYHRLSIAVILGLPLIPAQLGCVDSTALDALTRYRSPAREVQPWRRLPTSD